ncbi:MAG TPA: glycosyltransferase family 4 protein [Thermoleophilaceae bacterium]|nr:glycosyltransferase family 4 protein [Thermoleophilaceae bacterium]
MRIALVASAYRPRSDGLDRHVGKLAAAVARRGAHVEILTQDAGRRAARLAFHDGVPVRRFLLPVGASHGAVAPGLWDVLRRSSRAFDLVHVQTPHPSFAAVVMRIGPRSKVFTPHVPTKALTRWPYMRVTRAVVEHAALTLCTSIAEGASLAERIPRAATRIGALTGGVDAAAIAGAEPFVHAGRVIFVRGPLDQCRRVDRAIGAMASLADDYRLVIAGAGPAERRLAAHADDLRVESRVHFVGPVGDAGLYRWLRTARVAVSLAEHGTSGIDVAEAISAGVPVVASEIPAHREAAGRAGGTGVAFVTPEGSPLEVADAISLAAAPREPCPLAAAPPSWETVADAMLEIYERSLNGHARSTRPRAAPKAPELV